MVNNAQIHCCRVTHILSRNWGTCETANRFAILLSEFMNIFSSQITINHYDMSIFIMSVCSVQEEAHSFFLHTNISVKQASTFQFSSQGTYWSQACFCVVICKSVNLFAQKKIHVINFPLEVTKVALCLGDFLTCSSGNNFVASGCSITNGPKLIELEIID